MYCEAGNSRFGKFKSSRFLLAVALSLLCACAPAPVPVKEKMPPPAKVTAALELFEKAETLYQEEDYTEALTIYQDYLRLHSKGPLADTALMKTGLIHMALEDYSRARKAFQRLLSRFPQTPFADDARLNVVVTYYKEGDYSSAIKYAKSVLRRAESTGQESRIHYLVGRIYKDNRQFKEAVTSYMAAYQGASKKRRGEILVDVKELIPYLKEPELHALLEVYKDKVPGGYLRLQLVKEYASQDRIGPAIDLLTDFINEFPHNEEIEKARLLMEELKSLSLVNRFSIGCVLPLTGVYSSFGNRALTGIELALHRFNAQSHVTPIQLLIRDSKGDCDEAAKAVESLTLIDGVIGIIGPMVTAEFAAAKAQALKVPIMTLTQKPDVTKIGDYVFRNFLTASLQVKSLVNYAVQDLGLEKFAILYPDEAYGLSLMHRFWDELIRQGAEVVGIESYTLEETDFSDPVRKLVGLYYPRIQEAEEEMLDEQEARVYFSGAVSYDWAVARLEKKPFDEFFDNMAADLSEFLEPEERKRAPQPIIDFEAIFIPDSFEKVGLIAPQFLYHDVADVLMLGTNLWHCDELIEVAQRYVQGAIVPDGFFVESPSRKVQDFVQAYEEVFRTPPAFLEAQAYDAAWILFEAVNSPQVWSRRALKMALLELTDFDGVTGVTSFDETGDAEKPLYLLKVQGRRFVQIKP